MATVALLIAHEGFQQVEYGEPKRLLEAAGHTVVTVSDAAGEAVGKDGVTRVPVDMTLDALEVSAVDGVYAIGGPGALTHLDTQETNRIFNEAMLMQKPYGAICISPRILAKANVLTGKKATGWNGDGALEELFRINNVTYVQEPVVEDGQVVTADGPAAATAFGEALVRIFSS